MPQDLFLIHGVFFEDGSWPELDVKPQEGVVAMFCQGLCDHMFSGVLERNPEGILRGVTYDAFGEAELTDVSLSETEFRFVREYVQHAGPTRYVLTRQGDGTWCGVYEGTQTGNGKSRCVLTQVVPGFFIPQRNGSIAWKHPSYVYAIHIKPSSPASPYGRGKISP